MLGKLFSNLGGAMSSFMNPSGVFGGQGIGGLDGASGSGGLAQELIQDLFGGSQRSGVLENGPQMSAQTEADKIAFDAQMYAQQTRMV